MPARVARDHAGPPEKLHEHMCSCMFQVGMATHEPMAARLALVKPFVSAAAWDPSNHDMVWKHIFCLYGSMNSKAWTGMSPAPLVVFR